MITPQQATEQALRATINHAQTLRSLWLTADKVGCRVKDEKDSFITVIRPRVSLQCSYRKRSFRSDLFGPSKMMMIHPTTIAVLPHCSYTLRGIGHHDISMLEAWDEVYPITTNRSGWWCARLSFPPWSGCSTKKGERLLLDPDHLDKRLGTSLS